MKEILSGVKVEYELIAGERRLRASKLAGVTQIPVVVRTGDDSRAKLVAESLLRHNLTLYEKGV